MKKNLSLKNKEGKWWSYGSIAQNKFGNEQASFKVTPELKDLFGKAEVGSWINFSIFEAKPKPQDTQSQDAPF